MGEGLFILFVFSCVGLFVGVSGTFAWLMETARTRAAWKANLHYLWKATLAGFFWPIGIIWISRIMWNDYWSNLPEK